MVGFSIPNAAASPVTIGKEAHPTLRGAAIAKTINFTTMRGLATDSSFAVWARAGAAAALYAAAMVLCILIGRYGAHVTPIWIPSAILAWTLLTSPARDWPIFLGLIAGAHLLGAFVVGDQVDVEISYLAANLASPLLLAALLQRKGAQLEFEDRGEVIYFLLCGGVLAPALSVAIAAAPMLASGEFDPRFVALWFLADGLSFVVFLPIFKIVASNGWKQLLTPGLRGRAFSLLGALFVLHAMSIFLPAVGYRIFMMLLIPYLIYIAFDAGLTAARAGLALSTVLLLCVALLAPAPVDRNLDPQGYLLAMQVYTIATVASVLPIAAALEERQRLYETASQSLHDAQEAWGQIIAAEAHYQLIADNASDFIMRVAIDGTILFASPTWRNLGANPETMLGKGLASFVHADDIERTRTDFYALVATATADASRHWQVRLREMNGEWRDYLVNATLIAPGNGAANEVVIVLRRIQEE